MEQISISPDTFSSGTCLPVEHTCDGEDRSPALSWDPIPAGTQSIALIIDDPDAPGRTFVQWVSINISANMRNILRLIGDGAGTAATNVYMDLEKY